jgi:hypothetical protein
MENKNYSVITTVNNSILERNNYEAQIHFLVDGFNEDGIYIVSLFDVTPKDYDDYELIRREEFTTFKDAVDYLTNEASFLLESCLNYAIEKGESAKKDLEAIKNGFQL